MVIAALDGTPGARPVDAAPFRAHVRHVLGMSGITEDALGVLTGVAPRLIRRLAGPGREHAPARIPPEIARRLLAVTAADVTELGRRHVSAAPAIRQLQLLQGAGWSRERLAEEFGIEGWLVDGLLDGAMATCSRLVDLQVSAGMLTLRSAPARVAA